MGRSVFVVALVATMGSCSVSGCVSNPTPHPGSVDPSNTAGTDRGEVPPANGNSSFEEDQSEAPSAGQMGGDDGAMGDTVSLEPEADAVASDVEGSDGAGPEADTPVGD